MKIIKSLVLAAFCALPLFSAEANSDKPEAAKQEVKVDYKDAFLGLALEKAKTYSDKAEQAIGKGVDFAAQEAPLAMKEFLVWRAWMHGIKAFAPPIGMATVWFIFFWLRKKIEDSEELFIFTAIVSSVLITISTILLCQVVFTNFMSFVQVSLAPRVYLIEQVAGLIKR